MNAHVSQPLTMPHNIEAEQALIGCLLFDNAAFNRIEGMVEPDQFYEPFHQKLFGHIVRLIKSGKAAEPITLVDRFKEDRAFVGLGGVGYLADLIERTPPSYAAPDYAGLIAEASARRVLIRTAQAILIDATSGADSSERVIARSEAALAEAARGAGAEDAWVDGSALADRLGGIMDGSIAPQSVATGFHGFDNRCGGIVKGRMNVFAGRPGMGKSAYAVAMMQSMARSGLACGFFSLEMDISELALRMGCGLAFDRHGPRERNPVYFDAQRQRLALDQTEALHMGRQALRELPIWFDDRSGLTPSQIVPAAKRLIRRWEKDRLKPGMIVVDHLHIVKPENSYGNRVVEVGEVSGALRDLAKETGVAVVALCQLSRANEARGNADKRPQMSDLRWSGEIEADAAQITFIHRPEKYLKEPEDKGVDAMDKYIDDLERWRDKALLINVKNRGGPSDFDHEINVSLQHNAFWE